MTKHSKVLALLLSSAISIFAKTGHAADLRVADSVAFRAQKSAAPTVSEIIGGSYSDPSNTSVAFIFSFDYDAAVEKLKQDPNASISGYICSGTLVGADKVLTAGHCIFNQFGPKGMIVWIGGQWYRANAIAQHPNYVLEDINSQDDNARAMNIYSDIGMITLTSSVTDRAPMPIFVEDKMFAGDRVLVAGFGMNENSDTEADNLRNFRTTVTGVDALNEYAIRLSYNSSNSAVCSGDSGGPVMRQVGGYLGLVAVTSQGNATQVLDSGKCVKQYGGDSTFDPRLQSQVAMPFLSQFSGISYLSSRNITFAQGFSGLKAKAKGAWKSKSLRTVKSKATGILSLVAQLRGYADSKRFALLTKIEKAARAAKSAKKLAAAQKALKPLDQLVSKLESYGIN